MENMEKGNFEFAEPERETGEEVFQRYVEELRLTPEDFNKQRILDVGASSAEFAKWAREHGVSSEIYSLEPTAALVEKEKSVRAVAERIPFSDESFDLIVSVSAVPNIYLGESPEVVREKVIQGFNEMARVLKPGGEIRLAKMLIGSIYKSQQVLKQSLEDALQELERKGMQIEKIRIPSDDTYEYENHEKKKLLAEAYLLIIKKPGQKEESKEVSLP